MYRELEMLPLAGLLSAPWSIENAWILQYGFGPVLPFKARPVKVF